MNPKNIQYYITLPWGFTKRFGFVERESENKISLRWEPLNYRKAFSDVTNSTYCQTSAMYKLSMKSYDAVKLYFNTVFNTYF